MKHSARIWTNCSRNLRKFGIVALAAILVLSGFNMMSLVESDTASASSAGLNLHAPFNQSGLLKVDPFETNQSPLSISGTPIGIEPATVSYRIFREGTDQKIDDSPTPLVSGSDFTFTNINLFPGLNRIQFYGTVGGTATTLEERYIYFRNSPSLYNLEVIDQINTPVVNFTPPTSNFGTSNAFESVMKVTNFPIALQGKLLNTNEVLLQGEQAALFGDQFVIETNNIGLVKGDYDISFTAINDSARTSYPYRVAFNNGEPLMLNVQAMVQGAILTNKVNLNQLEEVLVEEEFVDGTNTPTAKVNLSGYLFVNESDSFSELKVSLHHISDEVTEVQSLTFSEVDLDAMPQNIKVGKYKVYNLENIELDYAINNAPGHYRVVFETFDDDLPAVKHGYSQSYDINYVNSNIPYIKSVEQDGVTLRDNSLITRSGQNVTVTLGGTANAVSLNAITLNGEYTPYSMAPTINGQVVTFTLDQLRPGYQLFQFTATDGDINTPDSVEEFYVEVLLSPTVKLANVNNEQIFNTNTIPRIQVEYVNVNTDDQVNTEITFNGQPEGASTFLIQREDGTDCAPANSCHLSNNKFSILINSNAVVDGRNDLKFKMISGGVTSEYTHTFYYLTNEAPFIDMKPSDTTNFISGDLANQYTTSQSTAELEGVMTNARYIILRKNGEIIAEKSYNGSIWVVENSKPGYLNLTGDATSATVTANSLDLIPTNTDGSFNFNATTAFTFEVFKDNKDQAPFSITEVSITRTPAAYDPLPITKSFLDKGVINRNYLPFTIDTDGAVSVSVNRTPMENWGVMSGNRTRFHMDVPLKEGNNKISVDIEYPGSAIKETIEITSSTINQPGAAYLDSLGKNLRFRMFNDEIQLQFSKGTLIKQSNPIDGFSQLYNDVPIFFGIAQPSTGLVLEENQGNLAAINLMQSRLRIPNRYALASKIFWVDAGQMNPDKSVDGGSAPYTLNVNTGQRIHDRASQYIVEPSSEGTLTLNYGESLRIAASHLLTVMYHDGTQWSNIGGIVNSKKSEIEVPFRGFGYYTVMRFDKTFNDVIGHAWARDDIEILKARGWMREISTNQFGTSSLASRGELATMLIKALDIPLDFEGPMSFPDVPKFSSDPNQLWDYRYIETAARVGIVRGGESNLYRPADSISRQETAVMIARAMNLKLTDYDRARKSMERQFTDAKFISIYAMPSVEAVQKKGIMTGKTGAEDTLRFDPASPINRAELATMTVRMLKALKRIEK